MTDKIGLKGEYIIEKVNKDGSREEIFRKENHLTDFTKSLLVSYFSGFFNLPFYAKGAQGGGYFAASGFNSVSNTTDMSLKNFSNSICLYGVNEAYPDVTKFKNFPFLKDVRSVDSSKITFIGTDNMTGELYANIESTDKLNLSVPNLISKSWKLTGPNGLGVIKTLCIGKNVHTEFTNNTSNFTRENTNPSISKILCTSFLNDNNTATNITGTLPPIKGFNDNYFYFGVENSNSGVYKSYNVTTDTFNRVQNTDIERNYPLTMLSANAFLYNDKIYYTRKTNSFYVYDINNKTHSDFGNSGYTMDGYKKGNKVILNNVVSSKYSSSNGGTYINVYNLDTKAQDTELFGKFNPSLVDICLNIPSWFIPRALGTRNDNENWLILDTYKGICIECTDLNNVLGTMINWYYTNTLANTTLNDELYFLSGYKYGELLPAISENIGTLSDPSYYPMIQKADLATDMLSIVSGIKDVNGNDIIQTEDSEYIFTYNLRIV